MKSREVLILLLLSSAAADLFSPRRRQCAFVSALARHQDRTASLRPHSDPFLKSFNTKDRSWEGDLSEDERSSLLLKLLEGAGLVSPAGDTSLRLPLDGGYRANTLGRGFCNWVYMVYPISESDIDTLVVKVFSPLAKVRVNECMLGQVDVVASDNGIGPEVLYRDSDGVVTRYINGLDLTEEDVHGGPNGRFDDGKILCRAIARSLVKLHTTTLPSSCGMSNMLWDTLSTMMSFVGSNEPIPRQVLDAGFTYERLLDEVSLMKETLEPLELPKVLAHNDFKPSNIIFSSSGRNEYSPEVTDEDMGIVIIDYELSGPGYRGYDFFKLFRSSDKSQQREKNMDAFLESYWCTIMGCDAIPKHVHDKMLKEMSLFEPLTWLEAGIFFLFAAKGDPSEMEQWGRLAFDRLENYARSKADFRQNVAAYVDLTIPSR